MSKMKVVDRQKEKERKRQNTEFSLRTGVIASLYVIINTVDQIINLFTDSHWVPLVLLILAFIGFLWGYKGKWYSKISNHPLIQKIIDTCTYFSIPIFIFELLITTIADPKNTKEKLFFVVMDIIFLIIIGAITFVTIKSKEWGYHEE